MQGDKKSYDFSFAAFVAGLNWVLNVFFLSLGVVFCFSEFWGSILGVLLRRSLILLRKSLVFLWNQIVWPYKIMFFLTNSKANGIHFPTKSLFYAFKMGNFKTFWAIGSIRNELKALISSSLSPKIPPGLPKGYTGGLFRFYLRLFTLIFRLLTPILR